MALIPPHGNQLKTLVVPDAKLPSSPLPSLVLNQRQLCDLELLLNGAFSPLEGFLGEADYLNVLHNLRLESQNVIWPIPITLDVSDEFAQSLTQGDTILLRNLEYMPIALLTLLDIFSPDKLLEAKCVFQTTSDAHPFVHHLLHNTGNIYLGGKITGLKIPQHYDFLHLRHSPQELRDYFTKHGWHRIVAFQTRNPMHRAHQELTHRAMTLAEANLLIHPVVGVTKPDDINHFTRVRCYEKIIDHYPKQSALLSLLPLSMRMAGPREALWHAIIRKNYGCSHFIVGRDHAGPGKDRNGQAFYDPYAAQNLVRIHQDELEIEMIPFQEMVYLEQQQKYIPINEIQPNQTPLKLSGTEFRQRLREGLDIPDWFSFSEIVKELRAIHPPKHRQGFTIFFTGLSGSGKSTLANALLVKLMEIGTRPVTLLDGDLVRQKLSSELGFSKAHRDLNIQRIGYVASEVTKNNGIAICAPIAPYESIRQQVRREITRYGGFIEIYLSTDLSICEKRDCKGLYAKARAGEIKDFTGIDDPYEIPINPELTLDTTNITVLEGIQKILLKLEKLGFIHL